MAEYVLRRGDEGAKRLRLLARVTWPTTRALLRRAGLAPGMRCLDLGCGVGEVTLRMARWVGRNGQAVGMDVSEPFLEVARQEATRRGLRVIFRAQSALDLDDKAAHDLVYARFLLSHVPEPGQVVARMVRAVRPGGVVVVEDTDFPGQFSHPPSPAVARYVELYQAVVSHNGGDAAIGPRLPGMLRNAGLSPHVKVVQPLRGAGRMAQVTMEHIREKVVAAGLASAAEVAALVAELAAFARNPQNLVSLPRVFQVWGRRR
jgi:ubiquinone/menaquinone biosynthesis C-methylase UbiE